MHEVVFLKQNKIIKKEKIKLNKIRSSNLMGSPLLSLAPPGHLRQGLWCMSRYVMNRVDSYSI